MSPTKKDCEGQVGDESCPVEHGAPHDGQRHRGKHGLEEELGGLVNARVRERRHPMAVADIDKPPRGTAEPTAIAKGNRISDGPEHHEGKREVDDDLGGHCTRVLHAREAHLERSEASLHQQHQTSGNDHPDGVDGHCVHAVPPENQAVGRPDPRGYATLPFDTLRPHGPVDNGYATALAGCTTTRGTGGNTAHLPTGDGESPRTADARALRWPA